ncbi:MAG: glycosyltransferase family 9 protein, partial [Desulfobacula sp.]|nr:glycosyltransferase family 9 protein [Desulfobacula sp.]
VQLSFLGDTILSTPVILGLKKIYPHADISVLTTKISAGLLGNDPLVDEVIIYDKKYSERGIIKLIKKAWQIRNRKFDKVYSLHRSHRTSVLLFLSGIKERIGFKDASLSFLYTGIRQKKMDNHAAIRNLSLLFHDFKEYNISKNEFKADLRLFEPSHENISKKVQDIPKDFIVMAPGSAWKTKQWHWQGYLKVAQYYMAQNMKIILIGGSDDAETCRQICGKTGNDTKIIDFSGQISILETMYIMKNAKLLVCNDSMALHMASAFKTRTVAVFCATSPEFGFGPWLNFDSRVVEDQSLECKPCRRHGSNKCPNNTKICMHFSAKKVIKACEEIL